jgi:hypothetical protein
MAVVLLLLAPSGLWMSASAATGTIAGLGFATLALATAACAALGWRAAVGRRYAAHGIWMTRLFALLSSAVVLRLVPSSAVRRGLDAARVALTNAQNRLEKMRCSVAPSVAQSRPLPALLGGA